MRVLIILSMFLMPGGEVSLGLLLKSREEEEGEAQLGGETGGGEAPLLLLGVRLLKAEAPEGEMEEGRAEGELLEYGANLCCFSLSARTELATPVYPPRRPGLFWAAMASWAWSNMGWRGGK